MATMRKMQLNPTQLPCLIPYVEVRVPLHPMSLPSPSASFLNSHLRPKAGPARLLKAAVHQSAELLNLIIDWLRNSPFYWLTH